MGKRLEKFREWLTPRRRLWIGIGLFVLIVVVPMVRPGTNMIFLVAPAVMILLSAFGLWSNDKR